MTPRTLPGGLELRTARLDDLEQIGALLTARGEADDALDHRLVVQDPDLGWAACAVVVDGGRVVSTATLLDETVRLEDVLLPAGQVELVATDPAYEGRGLVRALMDWAHERSEQRGHLLQVMIGIPYFYRLFGYEYAIDVPRAGRLLAPAGAAGSPGQVPGAVAAPPTELLRRAGAPDLPQITALQDAAQAGFDVAVPHPPARRRWLLAHDASTTWVLERDGHVVATARVSASDEEPVVAESAATDARAADALLAALSATIPGELHLVHRAGTVTGDAWGPRLASSDDQADQYYARIARPERLLDALRPVLHRRLERADLLGADRDLVLSTFRRHYRLPLTAQGIGPVSVGGTMQAPGAVGGAGVAPDHVPALLLGPHGLRGLRRRHADVYPGPDAATYEALFPPLTADLLTYYLPW